MLWQDMVCWYQHQKMIWTGGDENGYYKVNSDRLCPHCGKSMLKAESITEAGWEMKYILEKCSCGKKSYYLV